MNCVRHYGDRIHYLELKYEDLCTDPLSNLQRIYDFLELDSANVEEMAGRIKSGNTSRWKRDMSESELEAVGVHISHTLRELRYET